MHDTRHAPCEHDAVGLACESENRGHLCAYLRGHAGAHQCACSTKERWGGTRRKRSIADRLKEAR